MKFAVGDVALLEVCPRRGVVSTPPTTVKSEIGKTMKNVKVTTVTQGNADKIIKVKYGMHLKM